jgi:hypothetical protein
LKRAFSFVLVVLLFTSLPLISVLEDRPSVTGRSNDPGDSIGTPTTYEEVLSDGLILAGSGFLENKGQLADETVRYYTTGGPLTAGFRDGSIVFLADGGYSTRGRDQRACVFELVPIGSHPVRPMGIEPYDHLSSFYIGNDPSKWSSNVQSFMEVYYHDIYDGVDLRFRFDDGLLKYDLILEPGVDMSTIEFEYKNIEHLSIDKASGKLIISTKAGRILDNAPVFFQDGMANSIPGRFEIHEGNRFGFRCNGWLDRNLRTIIDPGLVFSTFLGGSKSDHVSASRIDSRGRVYVVGTTLSPDFPVTEGAAEEKFNQNLSKAKDGYVAVFNTNGSALLGCTYVGGEDDDIFTDLAILPSGEVVVAGHTNSSSFPLKNHSLDSEYNDDPDAEGLRDICLCRLSPNLQTVLYSTYYGGSGYDGQTVLDVDAGGDVYLSGVTNSNNFPISNGSYQQNIASQDGTYDIFAVRLDPLMKDIRYSTYIGGMGHERTPECSVDVNVSLYFSAWTTSSDLNTTDGAYCSTYSGGPTDGYIWMMSPNGSAVLASTYFGGDDDDPIADILVDSRGRVSISGATNSTWFNTTPNAPFKHRIGAVQQFDSFITIFDSSLSDLLFSTILGSNKGDIGYDLTLSKDEETIYFIGSTVSTDLDTTEGCYNDELEGSTDLFIAVLNTTSKVFEYISYFGGSEADECLLPARVLSVDEEGAIYFASETTSDDFPVTTGARETKHHGSFDVAVVKLIPETCPIPKAPLVSWIKGDLWINLTWDLSGYESTRLKDVYVFRGMTSDRPDGSPKKLGRNATFYNDTFGLTFGQTYYYWVSVVDATGVSNRTGPIVVKLRGPPLSDIEIDGTSGDGTVRLKWNGTVDWRGGDDRWYRIYRWIDGAEPQVIEENISVTAVRYHDTDNGSLVDGIWFYYAIQPYHEEYDGDLTNTSVLVFRPASPPLDIIGREGDREIELSWQPPLSNGGRDIEGYYIERRGEIGSWVFLVQIDLYNRSYTDTGLENGSTYWYRIRTFVDNLTGEVNYSDALSPFGPPSIPHTVIKISELGNISLLWSEPETTYGREILFYNIYWGINPGSLTVIAQPKDTDWIHPGPEHNLLYYFKISAVNSQGEGPLTAIDTVFTLMRPTKPLNLQATCGTYWVALNWDPPVDDGGNTSLTYHVQRWTEGAGGTYIISTMNTNCIDEDVEGGWTYHYAVIAENPKHSGPESDPNQIQFLSRPGKPIMLGVDQKKNYIELRWDLPDDTGGYEITNYTVQREVIGGGKQTFDLKNSSLVFIDRNDVQATITYIYSVMAYNQLGWGEYGIEMNITVIGNLSEPHDLTWKNVKGNVELQWQPPVQQDFIRSLGYSIYRGEDNTSLDLIADKILTTIFIDESVKAEHTYFYYVKLDSNIGLSNESNMIEAYVEPRPPDPPPEDPYFIALIIIILTALIGGYYTFTKRKVLEEAKAEPLSSSTAYEDMPKPPWARSEVESSAVTAVIGESKPEAILKYMIEEIYVVYSDGRPITRCAIGGCGSPDADQMSGLLTAIQGLIQDGQDSGVRQEEMRFGDNLISLAAGEHVVLAAVVYGRPDEQFHENLNRVVINIEGTYSGIIENWTGEPSVFEGLDSLVLPLIDMTASTTRDSISHVQADQGVALISAVDFHKGYVRLNLVAVNATFGTIIDSAIEVYYDSAVMRLERVEPSSLIVRR